METRLKNHILNITNKPKYEKQKKSKKYPKIIYSDDKNKEIKVIQAMFKIKAECNNIIHFNKKYQENLNINNYIYEDFQLSHETNEIEDSSNINQIKIFSKSPKNNFPISEVAKFIAYGNPSHTILKKLLFQKK